MKLNKISKTMAGIIFSTCCMTSTYAEDISAVQAFEQLNDNALIKLREANIDVNALLTNKSNDFLVNFDQNRYATDDSDNSNQKIATRKYRAVKDSFHTQLKDSVLLRDYYGSPTSFYRITSKEDLVILLNSPDVVSIQPNINLEPTLQESLKHIRQPETSRTYFKKNGEKYFFKGKGSVIAILDTGLDATRSEFGQCSTGSKHCSVIGTYEFAEEINGKTDGQLDDDPDKHGTNVSGIALGVAPEAKLIGLDVFYWQYDPRSRKNKLSAPSYAITGALNWIYNNHISRNNKGLDIVSLNMSLGGGYHRSATNSLPILGQLKDIGVASVVATGNDAYTDAIAWPASEVNAISVGAVHDIENLRENVYCGKDRYGYDKIQYGYKSDEVTCFSNSNKLLDILAPGYNITAAGITMSGTSQATPHMAGAYAVLRSPAVINITQDSVDDTTLRFKQNGIIVTDQRNGIARPRVDLYAALMSLNNS